MTTKLNEEVNETSNLAEGVREKAEKRGEKRGIAIGEERTLFKLLSDFVTDGIISVAEAARRAGTTEAEFIEKTGIRP